MVKDCSLGHPLTRSKQNDGTVKEEVEKTRKHNLTSKLRTRSGLQVAIVPGIGDTLTGILNIRVLPSVNLPRVAARWVVWEHIDAVEGIRECGQRVQRVVNKGERKEVSLPQWMDGFTAQVC